MLALIRKRTYSIIPFLFFLFLLQSFTSHGQVFDSTRRLIPVDSLNQKAAPATTKLSKIDSVLKYHTPKKAAIRSAIMPGLGQVYNKKYWKVPIIYGALGTTAVVFFYNLKTYKALRFAYQARYKESQGDSSDVQYIRQDLIRLDLSGLRSNRNSFRKNIDYSVLVFILFWGFQVADAAVDAHLKTFDVSPDLTFKINFGHSQMAGTNGISFILALK
jgi:hypothetical protein